MICSPGRVLLIALLSVISVLAHATDVEVRALFKNAAMLKIDGQDKMLKIGQSHGGVTLLEANSRVATIEVAGRTQQVTVSQRISGNYTAPAKREVSIPRNSNMQYLTRASLNGRTMEVLVDTGANVVAMNSAQAASLGIDFRSGTPSSLQTAGGNVDAWMVTLESVDVGGIRVNNVQASVVDGIHPSTILLGMTYLRHVELHEKNGILMMSTQF